MLPEVHDSLNKLLLSVTNGTEYKNGLVIGCHPYDMSSSTYEHSLLKKYTEYLCCMDIDTINSEYQCQINRDVIAHDFKKYEYDVIYMFDVIEHVPQKEGERILATMFNNYEHVYITTPLLYIPLWGHVSQYSEEYLRSIGYKTYTIPFNDLFAYLTMRYEIVAYK